MPERPTFARGPRDRRRVPSGKIKIPAPDPQPQEPEVQLISFLLPVALTVVGLVVIIAASSSSGGGQALWISMAISLPMMLGSYVVRYLSYRSNKRAYEEQKEERVSTYKAMLDKKRTELTVQHTETRQALLHNHPGLSQCLSIVESRDPHRLWARAPNDDDFLDLRIGCGEVPLAVDVDVPEQNALRTEPLLDLAHDLSKRFETVPRAPITLPLAEAGVAGISGPRQEVRNAARALAVQLATHHSPHDVKLVVVYPRDKAEHWAWMRWLPHVWSPDRERRYMASDAEAAHELLELIQQDLEDRKHRLEERDGLVVGTPMPNWVFLLAAPTLVHNEPIYPLLLKHGKELGAYSLLLSSRPGDLPKPCERIVRLTETPPVLAEDVAGSGEIPYDPDPAPLEQAETFGRTIAPVRLKSHVGAEIPDLVTLFEVLGIQDVDDLRPLERWNHHDPTVTMSVPIGKRAGGDLQHWDVQEEPPGETATRDKWFGPHALVAGTTGAGKGEVLRSLLLSMAANFHPHLVSFVLLDFKPPDFVDGLIQRLPHTISTITLLDVERVPRALTALEAELKRRERLFEEAGKRSGQPVRDIRQYMRLYDQGVVDVRLPYLILVVDEFTILKEELPDALDHFVRIAAAGRVFGFRMILATQRPTGVVKGQIEANTKSRMCLMVTKPEESREVIGDAGAAYFRRKGRVRWRYKQEAPANFQSAWATAPYQPDEALEKAQDARILSIGLDGSRRQLRASLQKQSEDDEKTQYQALIEHIEQVAEEEGIEPLLGVWLEPLPETLSTASLTTPTVWDGGTWQPGGEWLSPVIGLLDDPAHQTRRPLRLDLGREGHVFICSGTGGSVRLAMRTLLEQLVRDHSPDDLQLYVLDCGSAGLGIFKSLPHTGAVIRLGEFKRVRRLFDWLSETLDRRRRWLDDRGYGNLSNYRGAPGTEEPPPALVVAIDNLGGLQSYVDLIGEDLDDLTSRGDEVGIHLILGSGPNVMTSMLFRTLNNVKRLRLALELDSVMDYKDVVGAYPDGLFLPKGLIGRGLCKSPAGVLECQVAHGSDEGALVGMAKRMREAASRLGCSSPHPIQNLPEHLDLDALLSGNIAERWASKNSQTPVRVPLGIDDASLTALHVDLEQDGPHFMVTGPKGGGKTTALRTWVLALAASYPKETVQFVLFDTVTKALRPLKDLPHVRGYGVTVDGHRELLEDLRHIIEERENAAEQAARPLIVVVVDDFSTLALRSASVVGDLDDLARRGALWGVHVILAGGSGTVNPWDALPKQVLNSGSGLFVGSHDIPGDADIFDVTIPHPANKERLPAGRAYVLRHKTRKLAQIATPGGPAAVEERVQRIGEADRSRVSARRGAPGPQGS
jgi:S-DNA-T family DNA segregation ATPase FtsK/SpoIIIE